MRSSFGHAGIGRAIMSRLEAEIVKRGHVCANLESSPSAVGFYTTLGYVAVGIPRDDGGVPMMKDIELTIALATIDDAPAILELQKLAYQSEAAIYNDSSIPPLTQTLDELRTELGEWKVLQACRGHRIVGSVRAIQRDSICSVGRLIVHPQHQRQGIGSQLMRTIEFMFTDAAKFELFTGSKSEGNIRLYERLDYRRSRIERLSPELSLVFLEKSAAAS